MINIEPNDSSENSNETPDTNSIVGLWDSEVFIQKAFIENPDKGFTLLYNKYHAVLFNHAMRLVWNREVAQDLVSDIFISFWQNKTYELINISYRAYLFRATRNASYNYIKRDLDKYQSIEIQGLDYEAADNPEEMMYFDELQKKIELTIDNLPAQCKKVFLLNRFQEKKYSEIASEMNLSKKTVEMHISKALKHLKMALKNDWLISLLFINIL